MRSEIKKFNDVISTMAYTCWDIWKVINDFVFQGVLLRPNKTLKYVIKVVELSESLKPNLKQHNKQ